MLTNCRKLVTTAQIMLEALREKVQFIPNGLLVSERDHHLQCFFEGLGQEKYFQIFFYYLPMLSKVINTFRGFRNCALFISTASMQNLILVQ